MKVSSPDGDDSAVTDRYKQDQSVEDKLENSLEVLCGLPCRTPFRNEISLK